VKAKKRRECNEYADRKSKRRPLGWIINSEQTAKRGTKHKKFRVSSSEFRVGTDEPETRNPKPETSLKTIQSLSFVVVRVKDGQELGDNE
jgi:hypothetical protein